MGKYRIIFSIGLFLIIFILCFLGRGWNQSYAQGIIPTVAPAPVTPAPKTNDNNEVNKPTAPAATTNQKPGVKCVGGQVIVKKESDYFLPRSDNPNNEQRWGGILIPAESACEESSVVFCSLPVNYLPERSTMYFYRHGVEVFRRVDGEISNKDSCAPKLVYFDLNGYERFMYDHFKDQFNFYTFDTKRNKWVTCPEIVFDKDAGTNGRLMCRTLKWGYFMIGWPSGKR